MHSGLLHLFLNLKLLLLVGDRFKREHGILAIAVLFCLPAIGGTSLSAIVLPSFVTVSASGGVFGIIGGYFADFYIHRPGWSEFLNVNPEPMDILKFVLCTWWDLSPVIILGCTPYVDNITSTYTCFDSKFIFKTA